MDKIIHCVNTSHGALSFYVKAYGETHFLFSQKYKSGVIGYFGNGVSIDAALDFSRANGNTAVLHTMEKLPIYIRYVEREYSLDILRKTAQKNALRFRRAA